jgi:hypothetical protein
MMSWVVGRQTTQNDGPGKNDEGGGPGNSKGSLRDFDFPKGP